MSTITMNRIAKAMPVSLRSPLPWNIREVVPYPTAIASGNSLIAEFHSRDEVVRVRMQHIVKACNAHHTFVEILRDIARQSIADDWTPVQAMRFVIRLVRLELARFIRGNDSIPNLELSCYWPEGAAAYCHGDLRQLPRFLKSSNSSTAKAWLAGWDFARQVDSPPAPLDTELAPSTLPWTVEQTGTAYYPLVINSGDVEIAKFHAWDKSKEANAAFIVVAVNAHAQTLALLHEVASFDVDQLVDPLSTYQTIKERARALLTQG